MERISTTSSTRPCCRSSTNSVMLRVEWPTVYTGGCSIGVMRAHLEPLRAEREALPHRTTDSSRPNAVSATTDAAEGTRWAGSRERPSPARSFCPATTRPPEHTRQPVKSAGGWAFVPAVGHAIVGRILIAGGRHPRLADVRDSKTPSAGLRHLLRRRIRLSKRPSIRASDLQKRPKRECRSRGPLCPVLGWRSGCAPLPISGQRVAAPTAAHRRKRGRRGHHSEGN